jgi:hypothetical protein
MFTITDTVKDTVKDFSSWDTDDLERAFGLRRVLDFPLLQEWMHVPAAKLDDSTMAQLELRREQLDLYADSWNEDELKFHFIAPLVTLVNFSIEEHNIHAFTQRNLAAVVNDIELSGRVDFVVATGKTKPIQPFFFLHEYKKEFAGNSDPRAQLLAEMLAARELNQMDYPMYGCYVVGRMWFFVVLEGAVYAQSSALLASDADIYLVFAILREAKAIIERLAETYA